MVTQGLKIVALFMGYGAVGAGGDAAAEATAHALRPGGAPVPVVGIRWEERCRFEASRSVTLEAGRAQVLRVEAGSGELEVEGVSGLDRIEAVARACASEEALLDALQVTLEGSGGEAVLTTHYPERRDWGRGDGDRYARLDLVIRVPLGFALEVDDSSGGMRLRGTGALDIDDSSGSILVEDARGDVRIDDSSGEVEIRGAQGDVEVEDGSGEIVVRAVEGSVRLRDGSGSIEVEDVGRDVIVLDDGSGSIDVRRVGGGFIVRSDGSGSIRHAEVSGEVDIPRSKRETRRGH